MSSCVLQLPTHPLTDSYFCIPAFNLETFLNLLRPLPHNGFSPKAVYLCGHPRHHSRYHTYSTKVGRQVAVVACIDSVSDHLVIINTHVTG